MRSLGDHDPDRDSGPQPDRGANVEFSVDQPAADLRPFDRRSKRAGARFVNVDVTDQAAGVRAVDEAVAALGGLDVLVHAAGVAPGGAAESIALDEWSMALAVNATGTFLINQAVFPHLRQQSGAIINFASAAGLEGYPGKAAYAAAKGAVVAWTRSIARELAPHRIRVNAVAPAIWTPFSRPRTPGSLPDGCCPSTAAPS